MTAVTDKPVIGLLGGIGSGKSTVAAELVALGCGLIDADAIGHELLKDSQVKAELAERWGQGIFDEAGNIDRKSLAEVAFASGQETTALNAIMHPRIRRRMVERINTLAADTTVPAIVVDAALLLETDWHELCTVFVFVSAPEEVRAERVRRTRGWNLATWKARENLQISLDIKADKAEHIVDNSLNESFLREQVRLLFHDIINAADNTQGKNPEPFS